MNSRINDEGYEQREMYFVVFLKEIFYIFVEQDPQFLLRVHVSLTRDFF